MRPHLENSTPICGLPTIKKDKIIIDNVQRHVLNQAPQLRGKTEKARTSNLRVPSRTCRYDTGLQILTSIDLLDKNKLFQTAQYRQTKGHKLQLYKDRG